MPVYPHIHLRNLGKASKEFRPKGGGSSDPPTPVAQRKRHARALRSQLDEISAELGQYAKDQKRVGVELKKRGVPLTAEGRVDEDLRVGSLKLNSRGLQLLSLKQSSESSNSGQVANFFITKDQLKALHAALDKYEDYTTGDRPRRFNLFETVTAFRLATIDDLWTGDDDRLPPEDKAVEWEIWVRLDAVGLFKRYVNHLELKMTGDPTQFVDTAVFNVIGKRADIELLIRGSAAVVELRSASSFVTEYLDLDPESKIETFDALTKLITGPPDESPITTILDTGVNYANPLIGVALDPADCRTIDSDWVTNDHHGHGTNMAGISLYGDLEAKIEADAPIALQTALESIVVSAPHGADHVPAHDAIERAIDLLPNDERKRILCLAQTAPGDFSDGRQSALSGVVDRVAWNDGENSRLICVAAGNVQGTVDKRYPVGPYDMRNAEHRLESPAQAINALTIGAATEREPEGGEAFAPVGDLCPSSRTSQNWDVHYAYKPDIVMEGGNHIVDEDPLFSRPTPQTLLLTANRNYPAHPLGWTGETSAATARAAGLATRLQAQYPQFRAETLRGLMVHSADWTPAMLVREKEFEALGYSKADAFEALLQCYGWGIPNEENLFRSAGDALTLIAEDELTPYKLKDDRISLREMKYFPLPWPSDVLRQLNQEEVELRCTLSYFAEPDPHAASRSRSDRYPSHRLRFDMRRPGEEVIDALSRINMYASAEDLEDFVDDDFSELGIASTDSGWRLGDNKRRRGTIHHDIWTGKAYDLADRDVISIFPVRGWWGDRKNDGYFHRSVRFSVILSVRTKRTDVDLYAEATSKVVASTRVAAPTLIVT